MAAVLLGVLYTHGVSGEIVAEHIARGAAAPLAVPAVDSTADAPAHHAPESAEHSAQDCASSQPQQGAELPAPDLSPLDAGARQDPLHAAVNSRCTHADTAARAGRDPAVLRL
ncbi:hypothetical protein [Streptomyces boluensis]|uniref:Uncharacterized protein n=1 Tax=Streptomyces boluensis TaxID=1775135 RepID=A0A964USX7_9ACTN|nr:hypothetical protein [Streptomyces boluensis]NBE53533.1 hypothetical protein [Streptomyces boluensis]